MESEGESGECDEEDLKVDKEAIDEAYGDFSLGGRGKASSGFGWGDIPVGEGSDSGVREFEIKVSKVSSPKFGGASAAEGDEGKGCDCKARKGASPKSIDKVSPTGDGGSGSFAGEREGGSQGRRASVSGLSVQQSQFKRTNKEEGVSAEHHQAGGADEGGQCFTLFVGNIPVSFSSWRLKLVFMEFGDVIDVFIPQKSSKTYYSRFAFVRFKSRVEALRAIQGMDGAEIEGQSLVVNIARFSRAESLNQHKPLKASVQTSENNCTEQRKRVYRASEGISYAQAVCRVEEHSGDCPDVRRKIRITSGNLDWLSASLVGTLRVGHEFGKVRNILIGSSEEVKEVSFLGGCRCLMTFSSVLNRNNALKDPVWNKWFFSMEPWKAEAVGGLHRFWITCAGVPVTAWNTEFFALIGKQWGRLIDVDEETLNRSQFVRACLLIESNFCDIEESIDLEVDGCPYIVQVSSSSLNGVVDNCNHHQIDLSKGKERSEVVSNRSGGSHEELGSPHPTVISSIAGKSSTEFQLLAGNELSVSDDIKPVLFGYVEENCIRILDEDSGCLTRINDTESDCRLELSVSEMRGVSSEEDLLNRRSQSVASQACRNYPHNVPADGYLGTTDIGQAGGGNPRSGTPGAKSDLMHLKREDGIDSEDKRERVVANQDQAADIIVDAGGVGVKKLEEPFKKFEATQEFINSSIDITTDVLVECKIQGITIPESVQKVIIEAMIKRHIQAEVDFYAESSSGG